MWQTDLYIEPLRSSFYEKYRDIILFWKEAAEINYDKKQYQELTLISNKDAENQLLEASMIRISWEPTLSDKKQSCWKPIRQRSEDHAMLLRSNYVENQLVLSNYSLLQVILFGNTVAEIPVKHLC